jgi:hypothetical protein
MIMLTLSNRLLAIKITGDGNCLYIAEGGAYIVGVFRVIKITILRQKIIFFPILGQANSFKNVNICSVLSYVITTDLQKHPHWFTLNTILNMPGRQ